MTRRYLLVDTETTGLTPQDKMVELAWLEVDEHLEILDEKHTLLDPQMPIPPDASGIHGITDADVEDAPTVEEFFSIVLPGKLEGEVVMVAHNSAYDRRYFAPWCSSLAGMIDTLRLARRFFPDVPNHKLSTLKYALDLGREQAHSALGDVRTLYALTRRICEVSGMTLAQLHQDSYQPLYIVRMPWGKHKGQPLVDLPKDYLNWLSGLPDLDSDLRYSLERNRKEAA